MLEKLKQAIVEQPDKDELWLIYSDYLQTQGIPQGELIKLHFAYQDAGCEIERVAINIKINLIVQKYWYQFNSSYWPSFQDNLSGDLLGPKMMVIPAGVFMMGSPETETGRELNEKIHEVVIGKPFAIGKYTIVYNEYYHFVKKNNNTQAYVIPLTWQNMAKYPVFNVSYLRAMSYCDWLSKKAKRIYRLPTEEQWEYSCRAGTSTSYWWGNSISAKQANCDYKDRKIGLANKFYPNPWGLYQVHGNVFEWCSSHYLELPEPESHPIRGGSFRSSCLQSRSSACSRKEAFDGSDNLGFRVTCIL